MRICEILQPKVEHRFGFPIRYAIYGNVCRIIEIGRYFVITWFEKIKNAYDDSPLVI